ncbi:hypothetical protein SAMN05216297_103414 [Flavobacterium phragmitis]|uniref:Uncharacterized protein n=1 Tax=Flavobacterium phragmitis TaxID=739143 RepID=A0A1I1NR35_9FLAO|nr:hypothetical protein SAMN05216297_103414 [Flavobacterium phragmitis]
MEPNSCFEKDWVLFSNFEGAISVKKKNRFKDFLRNKNLFESGKTFLK